MKDLKSCIYCKVLNFKGTIGVPFDPSIMTLRFYAVFYNKKHRKYHKKCYSNTVLINANKLTPLSELRNKAVIHGG